MQLQATSSIIQQVRHPQLVGYPAACTGGAEWFKTAGKVYAWVGSWRLVSPRTGKDKGAVHLNLYNYFLDPVHTFTVGEDAAGGPVGLGRV